MVAGSEPRSKGRTGRPWRRHRGRMVDYWRRNQTPCWLCGEPINWDLPYRDPLTGLVNSDFGTLDHLDPISLGGAPHDPQRSAPAHMGCNSKRGNGTRRVALPVSRRW